MSEPAPGLHFELLTLFPELFDSFLTASLLGKAIDTGLLAVSRTNPRDHGLGRHRSVDDAPYGGGPGMVLRPEPLAAAIEAVEAARGPTHRVLLSPQGRLFSQAVAAELVTRPRILLVCGRYEGVDERIATHFCHDVLSIGDYVLAGGELAAAVVIEAVARLLPGVLGKCESTVGGVLLHGRPPRISALHAPARVPGAGRAGGAALGGPRRRRRLAPPAVAATHA